MTPKRTSRATTILLAIAGTFNTPNAATANYKADPVTIAKSYKYIVSELVWSPKGELVQPIDFRRWVFIGAGLTPHWLNEEMVKIKLSLMESLYDKDTSRNRCSYSYHP